MGVNTTITGQVAFNDCRIPVENIVGEEGKGFYQAMSFFDLTRCYVAAMSLGASEAALEKTINYVKQRIQFGVPVASHEWIQFRLTEDATRIEAGRLLLYRAARVVDLGQPNLTWSSMAKYYCTEEVAERVLWDAIQYHGGYGYIYDFDVERWYRDNRIQEIWEGTNEIQRYTIARAILGKF
jgi:alkylation response protein AidB-like acyl-CoA dehydrogenase